MRAFDDDVTEVDADLCYCVPTVSTGGRATLTLWSLCRSGLQRLEECGHYGRIELDPSTAFNLLYRFRDRRRRPIWPVRCHSIEGVRYSQDSGFQRYVIAKYKLVETASVIVIVVMLDHLGYVCINHWFYNSGPHVSVSHNVLVFFGCQAAELILDSLVNGDLPNVVQ